MSLLRPLLTHYAGPLLAQRFDEATVERLLGRAFGLASARLVARNEASVGGRLMVRLAELAIGLYRALLEHGLDEAEASEQVRRVTAAMYGKMAGAPWWVARATAGSPINRLRRATEAFRVFPFGPPAYVMEDVDAPDDVVAFDVHRCPVAEIFHAHGLGPLCVETFCNLDFALAERWGARLERGSTLAGGAQRCDFRWRLDPGTTS